MTSQHNKNFPFQPNQTKKEEQSPWRWGLLSSIENVTVDTNTKAPELLQSENALFFGISEHGVQTDLTSRDIDELILAKEIYCKTYESQSKPSSQFEFLHLKRKKSHSTDDENFKSSQSTQLFWEEGSSEYKKENSSCLSMSTKTYSNISKTSKKKLNGFVMFKSEFEQMHCKEEPESEKVSLFYDINCIEMQKSVGRTSEGSKESL